MCLHTSPEPWLAYERPFRYPPTRWPRPSLRSLADEEGLERCKSTAGGAQDVGYKKCTVHAYDWGLFSESKCHVAMINRAHDFGNQTCDIRDGVMFLPGADPH